MFWVQNFEFLIFGVSSKINIFWDMKILLIFSKGHHKIGLYLGIISMHLGGFLKVKVHNRGYFFGLLKFQIFIGCFKFLIFYLGEQ